MSVRILEGNAAVEAGAAAGDQSFAGLRRSHYRVILADPPWSFETWLHRGQGRGASQHYQTMATAEIAALPVADLAAGDCVLFLWGVWPLLPDALEVIASWGFTYKTCGFVWVKQTARAATLWADLDNLFMGLGYGTRGNSELCLRAARGAPKCRTHDVSQLILAPRRQHSRKPEAQYDRIERLYDGPYLELFARTKHDGWDGWGDQAGMFAGARP